MTNEEKQAIVNEVLAALHTHGKTIGQLTPVTSPSDSDTFELSGGRNLSYGKLKELITAIFTAALNGYVPADALWEYIQQYVAKLGDNGALDWQESPVVMLDTMGTTYDNVDGALPDYTLQEGDMFYNNNGGYQIFKRTQSGAVGLPAKEGVVYINIRTMHMYKWTGSTMMDVGIKYTNMIQISKMNQTNVVDIPVGKMHYVPSLGRLVYRITSNDTFAWAPSTKLVYIDVSNNTLYRWQGNSFQKVSSNVHVINDLVTGGEAEALSAEQGKVLKVLIDNIGTGSISAFANYDVAESVSALPAAGVATTGYIVGNHIYAYVGTGGDTADGAYQDLGALEAAGVSVTTAEDGTFTIHAGGNDYTVNLNHTHENMAKLVVCEESDLPSTLDPATIYAQVDDADTPTEIQSLWIAGLEFVGGGGVPDDEPRLTSPRSGATIDFAGQSTVTLFVKGKNLTSALSIAITGDFTVTLNGSTVSSISASDANNGVTLTLTQGSTFLGGTIAISSTEVDTRTCSVEDSEGLMPLNGIKLTGTQWGQTDFVPTANTDIQMKMKLTANANTGQTGQGFSNFLTCYTLQGTNKQYALAVSWPDGTPTTCRFAPIVSASSAVWIDLPMTEAVLDNSILTFTHAGAFRFVPGGSGTGYSGTLAAVVAQVNPLTLGLYHTSGGDDQIFSKYDLTVYELKITDNGTLVRNYVPMRRAGVPGLYDTITGHFMSSKTSTDFVEIS